MVQYGTWYSTFPCEQTLGHSVKEKLPLSGRNLKAGLSYKWAAFCLDHMGSDRLADMQIGRQAGRLRERQKKRHMDREKTERQKERESRGRAK